MSWERSKTISDGLAPWWQLAFAICAGGFALQQYFDKIKDDKVEKVMKFVERYNGDRVLGARTNIEMAWRVNEDLVVEALKAPPGELDSTVSAVVNGIVAANDLEPDLNILFGFFDELAVCARRTICDPGTAQEFFGSYAKSLYHQHFCFLQNRREQISEQRLGWGLEWFAGRGAGGCAKVTGFARVAQRQSGTRSNLATSTR
jgi:uncharacterized membrane protein YkvA (DUF1232 family)